MSKVKRTRDDLIFDLINIGILFIALILIIYPLYFIVIASISDPNSLYQGLVKLLPKDITFEGYKRIFNTDTIWTGYRNSLIYMLLGTTINVCLTVAAAYALSRKDLVGRNTIMLFITFTMFFGGGLIPTYLVVKKVLQLNNIWNMIIPNAVGVWNLIVARTFFQSTIPDELLEAAVIDGASNFNFFFKIVLPLSKPLLAIMVLFYGVNHWNAFFEALIYLKSEKLYPLQLVLRGILIQNEVSVDMMSDVSAIAEQQRIADLIKYGVIIIASLPLLILYPFLQKYFVKGMMIGAVKG